MWNQDIFFCFPQVNNGKLIKLHRQSVLNQANDMLDHEHMWLKAAVDILKHDRQTMNVIRKQESKSPDSCTNRASNE